VAKAEMFGAWGMVNYLGMMKFQPAISDLSPKYLVAILLPNIWGGYFAPYEQNSSPKWQLHVRCSASAQLSQINA